MPSREITVSFFLRPICALSKRGPAFDALAGDLLDLSLESLGAGQLTALQSAADHPQLLGRDGFGNESLPKGKGLEKGDRFINSLFGPVGLSRLKPPYRGCGVSVGSWSG